MAISALRSMAMVVLLAGSAALLSACGTATREAPTPIAVNALDPWGPHIREASARFDVPEQWIRAVIEVESGGNTQVNGRPITSRAGAMGLMQIMPDTWTYLRRRHGLGSDPHDPRDNILAGTAYVREMYDRFGAPGNFAAYNAGPRRLEDHVDRGKPLPAETRNYVAMIWPAVQGTAPRIRVSPAVERQIAVEQAPPHRVRRVTAAAWAGRDTGTTPADLPQVAAAPRPSIDRIETTSLPAITRTETVSIEPIRPLPPLASAPSMPASARQPIAPQIAASPPRPAPIASTVASVSVASRPGETWGVQVGAFRTREQADKAVQAATAIVPDMLRAARPTAMEVDTNAGTLFRARLVGLDARQAVEACRQIAARGSDCRVVPPSQV
jgi:D-alanyl-D-alanine carboxypeptidase